MSRSATEIGKQFLQEQRDLNPNIDHRDLYPMAFGALTVIAAMYERKLERISCAVDDTQRLQNELGALKNAPFIRPEAD